jgi:phosphonate transport system substrate-binding protein
MEFKGLTIGRFFALVMLCCLIWRAAPAADTAPIGAPDRDNTLFFGYTPSVFYNVDPRDVIGLMDVWARMTEHKMNSGVKTVITIYKSTADAEKALRKNEVDVLVTIPEDFIRLRATYRLVPILSADYGSHFYNELLLLVRGDGGITGIEQLRGKSLIVDIGQQGSIPMKWLDSLLIARVSSNAMKSFSKISECTKANQAVMPVFFRQADACLVNRNHYETMVELNPQLGRQLRILEQSPGFVTGIIAIRKEVNTQTRDNLVTALQGIHTDPKGKQLMTLFRINRLVPFKPEHLVSVEKVLRERRGKTDSVGRRKP